MRVHRVWLGLGLVMAGLVIAACNGSAEPPAASVPEANTNQPIAELNETAVSDQAKPTATPPPPSPTFAPSKTPSPTPVPSETLTPSPTPTATVTPTPWPSPTPTPALRQLTQGGCCVQPSFSPDGQQVLFIDKPTSNAPVGIYGVEIQHPPSSRQAKLEIQNLPAPVLVYEAIGFRSPDRTIVATMEGDLARFVDESTGQSWTVDTGGNWPRYAPDSSQILWVATDREGPYDRRQSDLWLAGLNGGNPRLLQSLYGGGFAGWFPDGQHILLIGRDDPTDEEQILNVYDLDNDRRINLFSHKRIRGLQISPGGSWITYFLTFSDESKDNGLWVVSADGKTRQKLDVPGFGAYRWRDDNTLLYIPLRTSPEESMQLWAVDVSTNQSWPLTDPSALSFSISNGDWEVSPDGRHVLFVSSADQNIWLITLPQVKKISKLHRGKIWVQSIVGVGSTFNSTLAKGYNTSIRSTRRINFDLFSTTYRRLLQGSKFYEISTA